MQTMLLAFGNRGDKGVLSGGSYVATMPLTNLQDRQLSVLARTPDTLATSSKFNITMPSGNLVRVLALANHNIGLDGKYRVRHSTTDPTLAAPDYDSGTLDVWPAVYNTLDLDWEADNYWSGKYLEEERAGYTWTLIHILPAAVRPLYYLIEIIDPTNANGFIQYGRLFMAQSWQPIYNANYGATLGWNTDTDVEVAISGAEFFDVRTPYRVAQFKFDMMSQDEGLSNAFEIFRRSGIDKEVLFMWDPDDTLHATRRQYLGRFRTLSPLEFPEGSINGNFRTSVGIEVKESVP